LTSDVVADREAYLDELLNNPEQPVVAFGRHWCGYCSALQHLLENAAIAYRWVQLDEGEYLQDQFGSELRSIMAQRTGFRTLPLLFVAGQFIGGCTETMHAWRQGSLQALLAEHHIPYRG